MNHLSFGRKEEGGLGTRIPTFGYLFESISDLFSIGCRVAAPMTVSGRTPGDPVRLAHPFAPGQASQSAKMSPAES
jgi:hypothetical protein